MGLLKKIAYFAIKSYYKVTHKHLIVGTGVRIVPNSVFLGYNKLGSNSYFRGELGKYSYIGNNCVIRGKIGSFCSISHNVNFITGAHPTRYFVSTHPAFYSTSKQCGISFVDKQMFNEEPKIEGSLFSIEVGNDVLIGDGATLIGPIKIGDGAIIGAHAVVTKDVEPYSVVVGSPARVVRKRFDEETIKCLIETKWWNWSEEKLHSFADAFSDIDKFIERVSEDNR